MTPIFMEVSDTRGIAVYVDGQLVMAGDDVKDIVALHRSLTMNMAATFPGEDGPVHLTDHAKLYDWIERLSGWLKRRV